MLRASTPTMRRKKTNPVQSSIADFPAQLAAWQQRIERVLDANLPQVESQPARLHQAMRYAVLGGGKRVRPALVYATAAALKLSPAYVDGVASAIECIHVYSLVHDDLPAMDNDDLRRGKPTCHKAFDEATAILAGDSLQVLAFEILASGTGVPRDAATRLRLVDLLAKASGTAGMAGGQALDLDGLNRRISLPEVETMHARKTGALIRACVMMAAACAAESSQSLLTALDQYATAIGLAFQIQDDLLDVEGDPALLGKAIGADQALNKPTYPAIAGVHAARERVNELHARALRAIDVPELASEPLIAMANWLLNRRH
jgi:geranylgeranyl pyrophosphate synthase